MSNQAGELAVREVGSPGAEDNVPDSLHVKAVSYTVKRTHDFYKSLAKQYGHTGRRTPQQSNREAQCELNPYGHIGRMNPRRSNRECELNPDLF